MALLVAGTLFVSGFLVFMVQPLLASILVPRCGGTPAVWTTCMVFFQVVLLAAYGYAHVLPIRLGLRRHAWIHLAVLGAGLLVLPVRLDAEAAPPVQETPVFWLLGMLTLTAALPFFACCTSAPLLQVWYGTTRAREASDPYFLYGASNLGSMLALLLYPTVLEPNFTLAELSQLWLAGYLGLIVLTALCLALVYRSLGAHNVPIPASGDGEMRLTWGRQLRWVLLAFVPSSLLLGVTNFVSTDIGSVPLLWVVPLALYLLTFVIAFARWPARFHYIAITIFVLLVILLALATYFHLNLVDGFEAIRLHLLTFFFATLVCHGELARDRPPARYLTRFYWWLSVGGVLGGMFNGLLAPWLFDRLAEYPTALALVCVALAWRSAPASAPSLVPPPKEKAKVPQRNLKPASQPGPKSWPMSRPTIAWGLLGLILGIFFFVGPSSIAYRRVILHRERSFFGVHQVEHTTEGDYVQLVHGNTLHGRQDRQRPREPMAYFAKSGPAGQIFSALPPGALDRVGIIGLGAGTLAAYGRPGHEFTFYEIDPAVERIALDPRYFTYLPDAQRRGVAIRIILGDARQQLKLVPDQTHTLFVVDAFTSDAVPIHLLTREAVELYFRKLTPTGCLALHISNRHLQLTRVLAALAQSLDLVGLHQLDDAQDEEGRTGSEWVVLARRQDHFGNLQNEEKWRPLVADRPVLWTDDYSNTWNVLRWQ